MQIKFHKNFRKDLAKLTHKQKIKVDSVLELFESNPFHPSLKNHPLHGDLKGRRAISAGGNLRLIFREENNYIVVLFLEVGTHSQVY